MFDQEGYIADLKAAINALNKQIRIGSVNGYVIQLSGWQDSVVQGKTQKELKAEVGDKGTYNWDYSQESNMYTLESIKETSFVYSSKSNSSDYKVSHVAEPVASN